MLPPSSDTTRHPGMLDTLTDSEHTLPSTPTDAERARILRMCLRATHGQDAAEDLTQETLLEAWRHWEKLREPNDSEARLRWLLGIAANVCRRWARSAGRELARTTTLKLPNEEANPDRGNEPIADQGDALDTELEYAERAQLLDRALGLLPPDTREALIGRYLLELPLAELAARHGLSEATLSVRLHRGKRALRQLLTTTLQEEALEYGLLPVTDAGWQETRIWCPRCGATRLQGQLGGSPTRLRLRCPSCAQSGRGVIDQDNFIDHPSYQGSLDGIKTFKAALNRVGAWADSYYRVSANAREAQRHADIAGIALSTAEARRFWRAYPRIRLLPYHEVEKNGRDVIVVQYEAVGGGAQLDTLFVRDNSELLSIHQTPGSQAP